MQDGDGFDSGDPEFERRVQGIVNGLEERQKSIQENMRSIHGEEYAGFVSRAAALTSLLKLARNVMEDHPEQVRVTREVDAYFDDMQVCIEGYLYLCAMKAKNKTDMTPESVQEFQRNVTALAGTMYARVED